MQDDFKKILGEGIPNLLKSIHELEAQLNPMLNEIKKGSENVNPELKKKLDEGLHEIEKAKKQMQNYGNFNNK